MIVANASGGVEQSNQYYPFGGLIAEVSTNRDKQDFKYNGKEYDSMHGLNQYDYAARYYDPGFIRFTTMDPMAEKKPWISPYVYCSNNPTNRIDPDGKDDYTVNKKGIIVHSVEEQDITKPDRLIVLDKNNEIEYDDKGEMKTQEVKRGILDNQEEIDGTKYMSISGNEATENLFIFLAK